MTKYYREKKKDKKRSLSYKIVEGILISVVVGIVIIILRPVIKNIPLAMLAVGMGALFVSLFLRPSPKAFLHALICAGCTGIFLLNLCPFIANIYLFEGYKAQVAENWELAIKNYEKALQYDEKDGELNFYTGYVYMKTKNYDKAAYHFKKSLETKLDPSAFNNLGNVYLEQGEFEKAEKAYSNALYTQVSRMYSLNNLGAVYQKTGRLDESLRMFKMAIEASPKYDVARKNLEVVEGLIKRYAYIKQRYGEDFLRYFFTAQSSLQYKREDRAKEFFLKAAEILLEKDKDINPQHPEWKEILPHLSSISQVYSVVGSSLVRLDEVKKAISVYEQTLNFSPGNIKQIYRFIASLYMKIGEKEKARIMLEKAESLP